MVKAKVYNQKGETKSDVTLNKELFGSDVHEGLMHQALVMQMANARNPIAHTKLRGEVRGGGRKPHRQKGTGRARVGSTRVPHWRGGGVTFGPRNNRNFSRMMPKKQRRKAIFSALSAKAKDGSVIVLDQYKGEIQTKPFAEMIEKLPVERNVLIVIAEKDPVIQKSARNLPNVKVILANYLNVKDLLHYHTILFLQDALGKAEETFLQSTPAPAKKEKATA
jgi:large subunit ribosomal protein L4